MGYFFDDSFELFCKLVGLDPEEESSGDIIEDLLYEKYNIEYEDASKLVKDLLPLCGEGGSSISGNYYIGFCDREKDTWLLRTELNDI